ncbi:protein of unknown function [Acidithiobacillus ferrivorans]|uniref:Uncharacterized protein n=1 Tax=Acidithiobacillus ferrivorans TaxID=160808 RepID=A0ABY1MLR4_9PROT|nr:protein of unknown function [Acidithiobacillus ferrivorans]
MLLPKFANQILRFHARVFERVGNHKLQPAAHHIHQHKGTTHVIECDADVPVDWFTVFGDDYSPLVVEKQYRERFCLAQLILGSHSVVLLWM